MEDQAYINPAIISWALERSGVPVEALARTTGAAEADVKHWLTAGKTPTFLQAQKIADYLFIPLAYLYLPRPPEGTLTFPSALNLCDSGQQVKISINLRDTLVTVICRQEWYKEYLMKSKTPVLHFIGSVSVTTPPQKVAKDIKNSLFPEGVGTTEMTWKGYYYSITQAIERLGVLVMCSDIADGNPDRLLSAEEFRGFVISCSR